VRVVLHLGGDRVLTGCLTYGFFSPAGFRQAIASFADKVYVISQKDVIVVTGSAVILLSLF
jgi:hypothetical protein